MIEIGKKYRFNYLDGPVVDDDGWDNCPVLVIEKVFEPWVGVYFARNLLTGVVGIVSANELSELTD